jgi:hypothetical protein
VIRKGIIKLEDIKFDTSIYPRDQQKWYTKTVEDYSDAMMGGSLFPPIILEEGHNRILDGVHRWKAYHKYNEKVATLTNGDSIEPITEIEVEWHSVPSDATPEVYAASLSARNGRNFTPAERRGVARRLYEAHPDYDIKTLMGYIPMSRRTVEGYVEDILEKRKEQKRAIALRLSRLGWSQEEIGGVIGVEHNRISQILSEMAELPKLTKNSIKLGHGEVARRNNLPLQVVWAIDLEGLPDEEKFKKLEINFQPYDVWNYPSCHDLFGNDHPGRIPGQIVMQVLAFYTNEGDVVIDPMAGSGTTADVCLVMNRKNYSYDIDDRHERPDIIKHDIAKDGWPDRIKKANLIFWDAPYFNKMDSGNIGTRGYVDGSISGLKKDDYVSFFKNSLVEAISKVKKGTKLAFLMAPYDDPDNESNNILINDYANLITEAGWKLKREFSANLPTQMVHPDIVNKFRVSKRIARLFRCLLVAEA